jgi:hypothetical protein
MKVVSMPSAVRGLVFDIDLTLYDNRNYADSHETLLIRRLSEELGKTETEMKKEVAALREAFARNHEGKRLSLGNTFLYFGISIDQSVQWREDLFMPEAIGHKLSSWADCQIRQTVCQNGDSKYRD